MQSKDRVAGWKFIKIGFNSLDTTGVNSATQMVHRISVNYLYIYCIYFVNLVIRFIFQLNTSNYVFNSTITRRVYLSSLFLGTQFALPNKGMFRGKRKLHYRVFNAICPSFEIPRCYLNTTLTFFERLFAILTPNTVTNVFFVFICFYVDIVINWWYTSTITEISKSTYNNWHVTIVRSNKWQNFQHRTWSTGVRLIVPWPGVFYQTKILQMVFIRYYYAVCTQLLKINFFYNNNVIRECFKVKRRTRRATYLFHCVMFDWHGSSCKRDRRLHDYRRFDSDYVRQRCCVRGAKLLEFPSSRGHRL